MSLSPEPEGAGSPHPVELKTICLEEAEETWVDDSPPFIDHAITNSIEPGQQLEVWRATKSDAPPELNGLKTVITCRAWKGTSLKYWICDSIQEDWRYIVGGHGVPNSTGWFAWIVWAGNPDGFTKKPVLWTRLEAQGFTPRVRPLLDAKVAALTDQNHATRQMYTTLEEAGKPDGTVPPPPFSDNATNGNRNVAPMAIMVAPSTSNPLTEAARRPTEVSRLEPS